MFVVTVPLGGIMILIVGLAAIGYLLTLPAWVYVVCALAAAALIVGVRTYKRKTEPSFPIGSRQ